MFSAEKARIVSQKAQRFISKGKEKLDEKKPDIQFKMVEAKIAACTLQGLNSCKYEDLIPEVIEKLEKAGYTVEPYSKKLAKIGEVIEYDITWPKEKTE